MQHFFKNRWIKRFPYLGLWTIAATTIASPTARLSASRTSGPVPLAVFFDATGTTDSSPRVDVWREIGYRFTFGDSHTDAWTYSGRSKNVQIGTPLAAHVFERPGVYPVQVEARDASGASGVALVTVTVQSADTFYPGARTVCLSRNKDFSDCPDGAQLIADASAWPAMQPSMRYLLHRGQDFTSLGDLNVSQSAGGATDVQVAAFGAGAKPWVREVYVDLGDAGDASWNRRVVIADLDAEGIRQDTGGFDLLLFRDTLNRGVGVDIASALGYYMQRMQRPSNSLSAIKSIAQQSLICSGSGRPTRVRQLTRRLRVRVRKPRFSSQYSR